MDFNYLRKSLLIFVFSLIVSLSILLVVGQRYQQLHQQSEQAQQAYQQSQRAYHQAYANRTLYERYLSRYIDYVDAGFIGAEQRLDWVEQLQSFSTAARLAFLRYDIAPREAVSSLIINQEIINPQTITIYQSAMQINLGLQHELDLQRLLMHLQQAKGLYNIQSCQLTANSLNPPVFQTQANISAQCQLNWYTIQP